MNTKTIFISLFFTIIGVTVFAQTKVGTVDIDYILSQMPETKQVQSELEKYTKELDSTLQIKLKDYQEKVNFVKPKIDTMTGAERKTASEEILAMENDIQKFRQNGAALAQIRKDDLLRPLYQKIGKYIEEIAKEKAYTQILTFDGNHLAYFDRSHDISIAVLAKMGITPKKE
ncbi:OmpH family outer membrane protein [Sungkyunkwania multivorans]|uniref:OmpH family outer membrane protein n=1 Tax=Sungkyunkwania multivorans TaxID=1173618 RepID=A0ABW3D2E3_9FLAO